MAAYRPRYPKTPLPGRAPDLMLRKKAVLDFFRFDARALVSESCEGKDHARIAQSVDHRDDFYSSHFRPSVGLRDKRHAFAAVMLN
jgi:hypothetical protein